MSHFYFDAEEQGRKSFELPGAKPHYNPDRPGQVEHICLDLVLNIPHRSFTGTCTITLAPVQKGITQLSLDAVNLQIDSVMVAEVSQPFNYDGEKLDIQLLQPTTNDAIEIAIAYGVEQPQRGIYFIAPDEHYPHKPTQVWTQGEDEDSRFWFPCFDYPGQLATSEIKVKVPQQYLAISNGELIATEEVGEEKIYHWLQKKIHPSYLMTLAVGEFAEIKDEWQGIPVNYYVEKGREEDGDRSMGKTPRMVEFFSQKFGYPYAYPKYAQVCVDDFIFGGMENTSTTLLTDRCLLDERAAIDNQRTESLVAHELAHQWFGDLVVIKHWSHAWIKEGMASLAEVMWTEHEYGKDEAAYYLLNEARSYINEDSSRYRRPIVTNVYREAIELYDRHLYEKGACVYHMINGLLGDDFFDRAIHTFVQDNAHKTVETIDLLRAIEKATGRNLAYLFDQYVFRGGHPEFKVSYSWDNQNKLAQLTITQKQAKSDSTGSNSELFDLHIPIAFGYVENNKLGDKYGERKIVLHLNQKQQSFYFPLEKKPSFLSFDLGNYFLKTVSLDCPIAELKAQLKHDPDPISRIYAAQALSKKGGLEVIKAFSHSLTEERFWGVRLEVAKQLGKIKLNGAAEELIKALKDDNAKVRRAVVEALGKFKILTSYNAVKEIASQGDESYYVEASALRVLGGMIAGNLKSKQDEVINLYQQILQEKAGWNEVIRSGAIGGLSKLKTSPQAVEIITKYTQLGIPQPLRLAAIRALGAISVGQTPNQVESILETLEAIAGESFFLIQVSVVASLKQMQTSGAISILQALAEQTPDGRVRRIAEEGVKKVEKNLGSQQGVERLRDDVEQLKQENQDLKSRLAKLEAK
ncbi:MAG: M1 family metallopeptidase [Spirulinaceae cyanobacterium]